LHENCKGMLQIKAYVFYYCNKFIAQATGCFVIAGYTKGGSITVPVDLLIDWFGISCMKTVNFCFYLQNRLIQTSQTGGQRYSDTSPFSIPWSTVRIQPPLACTKMDKKYNYQMQEGKKSLL
jgi:hypothetical protein